MGTLFSAGPVLQGAHFLSHNVWTLLFDWTICPLLYLWILYRDPQNQCVKRERSAQGQRLTTNEQN